ncbi:HAD-IC family P-type ATPase [Christensenellaceae bacterium OttesenSCG-928-L17]|nr:HAD-IC family P-type ATPase [Christensenellaceae bacterium OttesenSCG-928-L17]
MTTSRETIDYRKGLTDREVEVRQNSKTHSATPVGVTLSVKKIFLKNILTPFNFINLLLAVAVIWVGYPRQALFFLIAIINTAMGIIQELRSKKILDKLSIIAQGTVPVIRNSKLAKVPQEQLVVDDIIKLESGRQLCADAIVRSAEGLELDESLLTGESDRVQKVSGEKVLSGSFVVAGSGYAQIYAVGKQSYAGQLTTEAKRTKKQNAPLLKILNTIIKVLAIAIIPIGILLFYRQYDGSGNLAEAVIGSSAAMVSMIPEGLILLTGITLTIGAVRLASRKALVQSLPSIETLARVDTICLDKTGTITDGTLSFEKLIALGGHEANDIKKTISEMMATLKDDNATARILRSTFQGATFWKEVQKVPFSSERKWSAVSFEGKGSFVLGAPSFVLREQDATLQKTISSYTKKGFRALCLAHTRSQIENNQLPEKLSPIAIIILSDTIRAEAPDTFQYFYEQGVTLRVISGDDAETVSTIASKAGIKGADKFIDLSQIEPGTDYTKLVKKYIVFGRVSPEQKKQLVIALKSTGHTVCMTGDGVNDVLALKESDCGVAMIDGSEAARGSADFILMTNNFSVMVDVLKEGRRVINNIESVACLYLVKTVYSTILAALYMIIPYPYPFTPLQMTPINALTVGIPSFVLALRASYHKPKARFLKYVLQYSIPTALCVVASILIVQLAGHLFGLSHLETSTINVLLTGSLGFQLLIKVAGKSTTPEKTLLIVLGVAFISTFVFFGEFFGLASLFSWTALLYLPILIITPKLFTTLSNFVLKITNKKFD